MLRLEKVNSKNIWDITALSVKDDQKKFIPDNLVSLAQAYAANSENGHAFPFGIYDDDVPVGFLMIGFDKDDFWDDAPNIADGNYNFWRLMIDSGFQGRGYGRRAMELGLDFIRTYPCGSADYCWLSYNANNGIGQGIYQSLGFELTDEKIGDEIIAVLKLLPAGIVHD